jgi:hypothetical protein
MTDRRRVAPLDDDSIEAHLQRRARAGVLVEDRREALVAGIAMRTRAGRRTPAAGLLAAAVAVLALLSVAAFGALGPRRGDVQSTTSPVPVPSPAVSRRASPESSPPVAVTVIQEDDLDISAIAEGQTVLVEGDIEIRPDRACIPEEPTCAIGSFGRGEVPVFDAGDASVPAERGAFAVTRVGEALRLMGAVTPSATGLVWSIYGDAIAGMGDAEPGQMLVVHGWLVGSGSWSPCEDPDPHATPPPPERSTPCAPLSWITASRAQPLTFEGTPETGQMMGLDSRVGLRVSRDAYERFAPDPERRDGMDVPRSGTYLLEYLEPRRQECDFFGCTEWAVIARIAPAERPAGAPRTDLEVLGIDGLDAQLRQPPLPSEEDRVVLAEVTVDRAAIRTWRPGCRREYPCLVGLLDGVERERQLVTGDAALREILPTLPERVEGELAFSIKGGSLRTELELLGIFARGASGELVRDVPTAVPELERRAPGDVIAVEGWLVEASNVGTCGPFIPRPSLPPDSPFECFTNTWIASGPATVETVTEDPDAADDGASRSVTMHPPGSALPVQRGAYQRFAPAPEADEHGTAVPRRGVYLVRLVVDTWEGCDACRGWQLVGRLEP